MIAVTGATGQLGHLVIEKLLQKLSSSEIVVAVRNVKKAQNLTALGVQIRHADYANPGTLEVAFQGVDKLLLISSSEVGQRTSQHRAVIEAAQHAGVKLLVYTSVLRADTSALGLAVEHRETEAILRASGIPFVLLRNGWYTENYTASIPTALKYGALLGCAGEGRIASAARADYATAAVTVLTTADQAGRVYELAGDTAYTLTELAAEIAHQSGKLVGYQNLSQDGYKAALLQAGLPEGVAAILADSDAAAATGNLFDDSHQLSQLIGRATTPLATVVSSALKVLN